MSSWPNFDVPKSWRVIEARETAAVMKAGGTPSRKQASYRDGNIPFVLIEDMTSAGLYLDHTGERITKAGLDASSAWIVPPYSVLLSMYATIGATAVNTIPLATNQAILAIVPKKDILAEFLAFCLRAHKAALSARNVQATQKNINKGIVETFPLPIPPLPEQRKIAGVLGVVQQAIEQQKRLLALTAELKKALLHQLFTQGLRGEPQKQTDIGPVPESWEVKPLRDCCIVQTGIAKGRKVEANEALALPYLRVANVQAGRLDLSEMKTITIRRKEKDRYRLRKGDVVLTEGGDFDKLGRGFIWNGEIEDCVHQNHIFAVRVDRSQLLPEFFAHLSQSPYGKTYFLSVAHKTTNLACINTTKLKGFPALIPTLREQKEIVQMLGAVNVKLAQHVRKKQALSELFRTLLHQLMTAQIRVNDLNLNEFVGNGFKPFPTWNNDHLSVRDA